MPSSTPDKVRENRLRRTAARRGFRLQKSRRRDPDSLDFGGYMLIDVYTNTVILGCRRNEYSETLDDVEAYLSGDKQEGQAARKRVSARKRA